jgi:CMP-N,N'-diacetyllegionaminic acid synthase
MNVYAVILARGGSKGVPGKNIREFCGKPLITWTIEEAKKSSFISRVIVNTDDDKIANVAREYGAEVFIRPPEFAEDLTTDLSTFTHCLTELKKTEDLPDMIVDLRPTAPLRGVARIDEGVKLLIDAGHEKADSVRAVSKASKHPYKMWKLKDSFLDPLFTSESTGIFEPYNAPRQELPDVFQNNGSMNAFWPNTVLEKKSMTWEKTLGFVMEDWESINIDTEIDFLIGEQLMKKHLKTL